MAFGIGKAERRAASAPAPAAQEELQPNIDGLSFDEVLLLGLVPGIVTVLVTRFVTRRTRRRSSDPASNRPRPHSRRPTSGARD